MKYFLYAISIFLFTSCVSRKKLESDYQMFQTDLDSLASFQYKELKIVEGDNLVIQVYTMATNNQEQAEMFNLPGATGKAGIYIVNNRGEIDLPKLGTIKVIGKTCTELKAYLKKEWGTYIKDIGVDVQMQGFTVNVLGEVKAPGTRTFKSERATILDALSQSGGLDELGKRKNIILVREESGKRNSYKVDITSAKIYQSPVFQLQQNDLILVQANNRKFKTQQLSDFQLATTPVTTATTLVFSILNFILVLNALKK